MHLNLKTGGHSAEGGAKVKTAAEQVFSPFSVPLFSGALFSII